MINYVSQTWEQKIGNKIVSITNLNPQFSVDEKRKVKLHLFADNMTLHTEHQESAKSEKRKENSKINQ